MSPAGDYLRARDADPKSSYGDFAALSHPVDTDLAGLLAELVCDGIIAPGYEPGTVERLSRKKNGRFLVIEADPSFTRYLEGDITPDESARLADALTEPARPLPSAERTDWLRKLSDVTFVSDGALPFRDNVDQAARHGVRCIAEPGGSIRSAEVAEACRAHEITLIQTGVRLFHH